jgi:hypothetical protein
MASLMNGLSSLGSGVAAFAGSAGLEQQKADLAQQGAVLADQLATVRESKGRQEAGDIAATAATAEHGFLAGQGDLQRQSAQTIATIGAGATLGAAGISAAASKYAADLQSKNTYAELAAAAPVRQAQINAQNQQTALAAVQTNNAQQLDQAHTALQAEIAKPDADPAKVTELKNQVTSLEVSAGTEAAITQAAAAMYRTDMDSVQHYNTQLVTATAALNSPEISDTDKVAQKGLVANLKIQLTGAQRALQYSSDLVHGRVAAATGNEAPGSPATGTRPPLASFGPATQAAPPFNSNAGPRAVAPAPAAALPGFLNNGGAP